LPAAERLRLSFAQRPNSVPPFESPARLSRREGGAAHSINFPVDVKEIKAHRSLSSVEPPGIIKAIEVCFPRAARQRCLAHRMCNLAVKVPEDVWPEFKVRVQAGYQASSRAIPGDASTGHSDHEPPVACFNEFEMFLRFAFIAAFNQSSTYKKSRLALHAFAPNPLLHCNQKSDQFARFLEPSRGF
jgi:hypothetical protein